MAKIRTNNSSSFKDKNGYSRIGGIFKSSDTKAALEKDQASKNARAARFSPEQNKQVQEQLEIQSGKKKVPMNDHDLPLGDQQYKSAGTKKNPRFRFKQ